MGAPSTILTRALAILLFVLISPITNSKTCEGKRIIPRPTHPHPHHHPHPPVINGNTNYIRSSCRNTIYRRLCYLSLSTYAGKIRSDPKQMASIALNITLCRARSASTLMWKLGRTRGLKRREAAAMADCVELVGDAVDRLKDAVNSLAHISKRSSRRSFEFQMSDVQTWVSAALTNEFTCLEGFDETTMNNHVMNGKLKYIVSKRIVKLAHFTSNSLALINDYAKQHQLVGSLGK